MTTIEQAAKDMEKRLNKRANEYHKKVNVGKRSTKGNWGFGKAKKVGSERNQEIFAFKKLRRARRHSPKSSPSFANSGRKFRFF